VSESSVSESSVSTQVKSRSKRKRSRKTSRKTSSGKEHPIERGLNTVGLRSLVVAYRVARFAVLGLVNSPFVLSLPLVLLIASSITDYLVLLNAADSSNLLFFSAMPVPVEDARRVGAETLKKNFQSVLYLITLGLCVFHWRAVKAYLQKWPHLGVLMAILLLGVTYSVEPTKVITNSILILVSILMPLLVVIGRRDLLSNLQSFYLMIFFPFFISHLASLMLLFLNGSDPFTLILSENRYGGFSGNPNSLGNSGSLGLWAAVALVLSPGIDKIWRLLGILSLPLFGMSVAMSGSGTALVASVLIVGMMFWMRVLATLEPMVRLAVNVLTAALLVCLVLSVLLMATPAELFLVFTGSLGKDASLTGRTDLWAMAKDAIAQRPYFGWSFDSHTSVKSVREFDIRFNHYHNGFLDTMIEGGILLMFMVLYNFGWFIKRFVKLFRQNDRVYPLVVPFVMIIVLNMSEYSLLRPLSEVWQLYIACFVVMTFKFVDTAVRRQPTSKTVSRISTSKTGRRKRSRRAIRWG